MLKIKTWLNNFTELSILKTRYVNIITRRTQTDLKEFEKVLESKEAKFALSHKECEIFLKIKSQLIEALRIQGDVQDGQMQLEYVQLNMKPFGNLKKLIFCQMVVTDEDLEVIYQYCLRLSSLHLIKCFCQHFETLVPGENVNIEHIANMSQLQEFQFEPEKPPGTVREFKLEYLQRLLSNLMKLNRLVLKNFTIVCEEYEKTDIAFIPDICWNLETLNWGIITSDFWCTFTEYLQCCPQLRELTIESQDQDGNVSINIKISDILSKVCKNLKSLCLKNCQINLEDFLPLQGLQELTLISCTGLTFNNLQQILGGLQLKTFKLLNTRVQDINNYIYIAPTLESITIDTAYFSEISEILQNSLNQFSSLNAINWHKGDISHNWIKNKCPQLQQLHLPNPYVLPRFVLDLKALKELTFTTATGLTWSLLKMLVSNLQLSRLSIFTDTMKIGDERESQECLKKSTTLELITIPFELFLMGLKYWLALMENNDDLVFLIYGKADNILDIRLLCLLLTQECVRKRRERIRICGFKLELDNFENDSILKAIVHLHINTNYYRTRNITFTLEL